MSQAERSASRVASVHKVGVTAAVLGLAAIAALPFVTLAANRLRSPSGRSLIASLGWGWAGALVAGWLLLGVASLSSARSGARSLARGCISLALVLGTFAACHLAAERLLPGAGTFARVSIGGGAWASSIAAYAALVSARRELGGLSGWRFVRGLLTAGLPIGVGVMLVSGVFSDLGMLREYENVSSAFWRYLANTIAYSAVALGAATVIGFGLGVLAFTVRRFERPVFGVVSVFQTIPGLAMVGLLFAPLAWLRQNAPFAERLGVGGLGWAPIVVALTLYALLAITRNTYAGLAAVPASVVDAGRGMGMSANQLMWRVRVPLALPVLFSGERTAAVQTIGNSVLGAFVAAFTLGTLIFGGLAQQAMDLTMLGSVVLVVIAVVVDAVLGGVQRVLTARTHADASGPQGGGGSA
jgi:osmoprotectant transport system permease protein